MNDSEYNIGLTGYTPIEGKGISGENGYSVHFSTLNINDSHDLSSIYYCIGYSHPLSKNTNLHSEHEEYNVNDVIIDDYGNFGVITNNTIGNISIDVQGRIFQFDDTEETDSSFIPTSELELKYNSSKPNSDTNTYNFYSFNSTYDRESYMNEPVKCPLYSHRDNVDSSVYGNHYYIVPNSPTFFFVRDALNKCYFAKIIITFSTGLIYEKVVKSTDDFNIFLDNRYYYGYGRGVVERAFWEWENGNNDASFNGNADPDIWGNNAFMIQKYTEDGGVDGYAETNSYHSTKCRNINQNKTSGSNVVKYSIVNARVEFYSIDGHTYDVRLKFVN